MLVLCYGLTKSGSTLAFELIKGMLETAGHKQERLPDGLVNPGHRVNYVQPLNRKRLRELLAAVGHRWIAVKTHTGMPDPVFAYMEQLHAKKQVKVVVSYRDPRDICLSMLDAGETARAQGRKEFSEITDLTVAARRVSEQIEKSLKWAAVPGVLMLPYDMVAFDPDTAMDRIERYLGIRSDRQRAREYAFEEAFTQKNKGQPNRFYSELTQADRTFLEETFGDYISNFIEADPGSYLRKVRLEIENRERERLASSDR